MRILLNYKFYTLLVAIILFSGFDNPRLIHAQETFQTEVSLRRVVLTGFTRPRTNLTLVSEESGKCETVTVDVGDTIGEDGVFAKLDTTFLSLELKANLADQRRLASQAEFYFKESRRFNELLAEGTVSQSAADEVQFQYDTAKEQLQSLKVQEQVLRERIRRMTFYAPKGWKVISRDIEEGEWIAQGQTVGEVGRFDTLFVPYAFTPEELDVLKSKEQVLLSLPELGVMASALVANISPGFDPETRKINVDLEIVKGGFDFRGGLRTELVLFLPHPGGALIVPKSSLIQAYEEFFLIRPEGTRVKVTYLGDADAAHARISSAVVKPGDIFLRNPDKDN